MNASSNVVNPRTGVIALPPRGMPYEKLMESLDELASISDGILNRVSKDTGFEFVLDEDKHLANYILHGAERAQSRKTLSLSRKSERKQAMNRGCRKEDLEQTNSKKARLLLTKWRMNSITHDRHRFVGGFAETEEEYERNIRMYVETCPMRAKWLERANTLYASGCFEVRFGKDGKPRSVCFPRLFWLDDSPPRREKHVTDIGIGRESEMEIMTAISEWTGMEYLGKTASHTPVTQVIQLERWSEEGYEFDARGMTGEFRAMLAAQGFLEEDCWCRDCPRKPHIHSGFGVIPVAELEDGMLEALKEKRRQVDDFRRRSGWG